MVDIIRRQLTKRLQSKKNSITKWKSDVGPKIMKKIANRRKFHSGYDVMACGEDKYEVTNGDERVEVNLSLKTCSCYQWQLSGIPCKHAIAAILKRRERVETYVYEALKKGAYVRAYEGVLSPIPDKRFWKECPGYKMAPPVWNKKSGRPKKKRRRGSNEIEGPKKRSQLEDGTFENSFTIKGRPQQCRNCWQWGHNKRGCKSQQIPKPPSTRPSTSARPTPQPTSDMPPPPPPFPSSSVLPLPQPATLPPPPPISNFAPEQIPSSSQPILGATYDDTLVGRGGGGRARGRGRGRGGRSRRVRMGICGGNVLDGDGGAERATQ